MTTHGQSVVLRSAVYALVVSYCAAAMRDVPEVTYVVKWVALATLATVVLWISRKNLELRGLPVIAAFAPWFVVALAYQVQLGPTGRGIGVAGGYFGLVVASFLLLPSAVQTLDDLDALERWCVHALAAMCVLSILLGLRDLAGSVIPNPQGRIRMRWGFEHVNTGGYLGYMGVVLTLRQVLLRRWWFAGPGIVFAFVLATSGSRGAFVALAIVLLVLGILELVRRRGAADALTTVLVAQAFVLAAVVVRLTTFVTDSSLTYWNRLTSGRLGAWGAALSRLDGWVDWLFGQGAGQNVNYIGTRSYVGGSSDSFVVDLLTRSGLLGLAIWLVTIVIVGFMLTSRYRQLAFSPSIHRSHLAFVIALGFSAVCAASYEGFVFSVGSPYAVVVWSCVGVACFYRTTLSNQVAVDTGC